VPPVAAPKAPPSQAQTGANPPAGGQPAPAPQPPVNFNNQTVRQIVHTSLGGDRVRVVFSNVFGTAPLEIGAAHVALRQKGAAIDTGSARALTFDGRPTATILPGAVVVTDVATLVVPPLADLAVDLYLPGDTASGTSPLSTRNGAAQTNYVSAAGNHAGKAELPVMNEAQAWFFLSRVEVMAPAQTGAVIGLGDSITAGARSTPDTNNRWLDHLSRRLNGGESATRMGVLNAGIAGNRLLADGGSQSALARFDRDVLAQTGITHLVVLEGANDIGARQNPSTLEELLAGHKQIIERARARGLKVIGATVLPFEGSTLAVWTPEAEKKRVALNEWIRTSKSYDAVLDFDAKLRDPNQPTKLASQYNSGDNIHPNDAGYQLMGNSVDLEIFRNLPRQSASLSQPARHPSLDAAGHERCRSCAFH
jgi:lysophospholipase L1-like esterase